MDTFRKWLNKPKADDKSLLARFYHADRSLQAVASELDSFDGRAEPDRCFRLVSRLRQSQDKVLSITNLIMDELLGDDRDPRSFRAKFPEEVLQENLAGQLWFGAECLAAGSSITSREQESKEMRPLAQAVTKSLGNVRNLLRDQCLRNNVPNSKTLRLDFNDSSCEQLCESLKIFDRLFAEFELRYVSAMVQVKTKHEYEMQELICVLFSETLQRALAIGLIEQDKVDSFDPALMFSIPRLAIIAGLTIFNSGPLNMDMTADQLSEMFRPFRPLLIKIRDLLRNLDKREVNYLEKLLCTNENIQLEGNVCINNIESTPICGIEDNNNCRAINTNISGKTGNGISCKGNKATEAVQHSSADLDLSKTNEQESIIDKNNLSAEGRYKKKYCKAFSSGKILTTGNDTHTMLTDARQSPILSRSSDSSARSTPTVSPATSSTPFHSIASTSSVDSTVTSSPTDWTDDEAGASDIDEDVVGYDFSKQLDIVCTDCASGYLIPNTNFGNLLQPQHIPLTDNIVDSENQFGNNNDAAEYPTSFTEDLPTTSRSTLRLQGLYKSPHIDSSDEDDQIIVKTSEESSVKGACKCKTKQESLSTSKDSGAQNQQKMVPGDTQGKNATKMVNKKSLRYCHYHSVHRHHHPHYHHHHARHAHSQLNRRSTIDAKFDERENADSEKHQSHHISNEDISSVGSLSASSSDGDTNEASSALTVAGRYKFKSTENLLHRLFVCIAGVADQLQTNFASDLRHILRSVFLMNMTHTKAEAIDIEGKAKDSELFEFRASENDVQHENAGSNQSIYSAEEANPDLDNVFIGGNAGTVTQRVHIVDLSDSRGADHSVNRSNIERSHSVGDQSSAEMATSTSTHNMRSIVNGRCLLLMSRQAVTPQRHQNRSNLSSTNLSASASSSSTSASSSSESNSPISERALTCVPSAVNRNQICTTNSDTATAMSNYRQTINSSLSYPQPRSPSLVPPPWIPDEKAPHCMACHIPFTAFRRRHHCRNCGGVFCAACSNASAPLPKYGLTKAVRICRGCYVREVCAVSSVSARSDSALHITESPTSSPSTAYVGS